MLFEVPTKPFQQLGSVNGLGQLNDCFRVVLVDVLIVCRSLENLFWDGTSNYVDRYGFEMSVPTPEGPRPVRLAFPTPVTTPDEARKALVALVGEARTLLASPPAS